MTQDMIPTSTEALLEKAVAALKPFAFAAKYAPEIKARPHDFVLTSEFNAARTTLAEIERELGR